MNEVDRPYNAFHTAQFLYGIIFSAHSSRLFCNFEHRWSPLRDGPKAVNYDTPGNKVESDDGLDYIKPSQPFFKYLN